MNLAANPAAAATIQENYSDWRDIKGLQLEGVVELLAGEDEARAREIYASKFPVASPASEAPGPVAAALARVACYRFSARRVFFIDNSAGFGKREEVL